MAKLTAAFCCKANAGVTDPFILHLLALFNFWLQTIDVNEHYDHSLKIKCGTTNEEDMVPCAAGEELEMGQCDRSLVKEAVGHRTMHACAG